MSRVLSGCRSNSNLPNRSFAASRKRSASRLKTHHEIIGVPHNDSSPLTSWRATSSGTTSRSAGRCSPKSVKSPILEAFPASLHSPASMTPAFNHLMMSLITLLSPMRCSRNRTNQLLETLSKNARMSQSTTQLTLRRSIPTASASSALCAPRPPEPVTEPQELRLVNRRQDYLRHCLLDYLVLYGRDAERSCGHPASGCSPRWRPGTLPSARGREGRPIGLPALPRTSPTSCHPPAAAFFFNSMQCIDRDMVEAPRFPLQIAVSGRPPRFPGAVRMLWPSGFPLGSVLRSID